MHIYTGLKTWIKLLKNKKGDEMPGWIYIISLILGLILIMIIVYFAYKSGQKQTGLLDEL